MQKWYVLGGFGYHGNLLVFFGSWFLVCCVSIFVGRYSRPGMSLGAARVPQHLTYGAVLRPPSASSVGSQHRNNKPTLCTKTQSTPLISLSQSSSLLGGGTLLASSIELTFKLKAAMVICCVLCSEK